ncbi:MULTISPECIES: hypothetical protein [Aliivibrio]|uniref:Uncharacterized protein n=1 Tax=Aliivibrio finisterrensis TaxID=511998 RepID=A0A4Q5KSS6_9GAMM|nr:MULTISPECIES: hypothetical protein [Aliivibrio]MDD9179563.1 hypothetical protein [Aliivibrio sp. A6]RYU50665.1 hypothetical protein ERW57_11785 [Aliivibrio finisterrensis]RYU51450.1 hypothetical protein ERW56_12430 [Aliivibrio finisterrensis]RYU54521.1 hypothetical protein ERW50_17610 [Aliivibrio finisterrensis]RYU63706.1 hypothetical protein ERW53_12540 [Aliivibrio finisterrensis]
MLKQRNTFDYLIMSLLQYQGLIKKEAQKLIDTNIYQLTFEDVDSIKYYATHFGDTAKDKQISNILNRKRTEYFLYLQKQLNNPLFKIN